MIFLSKRKIGRALVTQSVGDLAKRRWGGAWKVPEHPQSAAEVPLSRVLDPHMLIQGPALTWQLL